MDRAADPELAVRLLFDGKTSRPGVCNALAGKQVQVRGDERTRALSAKVAVATNDDYAAEFMDLILDGGELGLGVEIGISTTRLHAYVPIGLESLTIEWHVVRGGGAG